MVYSEARGTLIYAKKLKSKISCKTPFKVDKLWSDRNHQQHGMMEAVDPSTVESSQQSATIATIQGGLSFSSRGASSRSQCGKGCNKGGKSSHQPTR
jgi:hypothetical protein